MDNQNFGQPTPPQTQPPIKPPLNKGLIIGLSAGIVILLAAVIYLLTSKPANGPEVENNNQVNQNQQVKNQDETTSLKTYRNDQFGFEVQIPADWSVEASTIGGLSELFFFSEASKKENELIKISCEVNREEEYCPTKYDMYFINTNYATDGAKKEIINNIEWTIRDNEVTGLGYETKQNGKFYHFRLPRLSENEVKIVEFLSTFKFIDQNETADWKTYRNDRFELQLTDAWKGYRVVQVEMSSNFGAGSLVFQVPGGKITKDTPDGFVEVMQIQVLNLEYWNQIKDDVFKPIFLGQNKNYVFVVGVSNDWGVYLPGINLEIEKVISTFKFTN